MLGGFVANIMRNVDNMRPCLDTDPFIFVMILACDAIYKVFYLELRIKLILQRWVLRLTGPLRQESWRRVINN